MCIMLDVGGKMAMNISKIWKSKHGHLLLGLLTIPIVAWFEICEKVAVPRYVIYSPFDRYIPFIKEFVVPYILWYAYLVWGMLYTGLKSRNEFYKLCIYVFGGMSICYIIYLLFPNVQHLRPNIVSNDIFSKAIRYIYSIDTPTNVCPSIHVFAAYAIHLTISTRRELESRRYVKAISFVSMLLASTAALFIKQHSIVDYIWGVVLALFLYFVVYGFSKIIEIKRASDKKSELTADNTSN